MGRKHTYEFVKEFIESLGYTLLEDKYENNNARMKMVCDKGHNFEMSFNQLYNRNTKCPKCMGNAKLSYDEVKEYIESQNYKLLSDKYIKATSKLKMKCPENHEFEMSWNNFKNHNQRCPICAKKNQKRRTHSYEYVKNYIESFGYKLISEKYINEDVHLTIKCPKHGEWKVSFCNFKHNKSRCPRCKNYKGEIEISDILNKYNIDFINKHRFPDCKYKRTLEFDFYLEKYNTIIEYDGEYHYRQVNRTSKENFEKQKIRDGIKNQYCKEKGINLIRIPYWEFDNIESILIEKLNL